MTGSLPLGAALGTALGAGLLSFLSPCVLPLVPAWLSYLSGSGVADLRQGRARMRVVGRSLAFSLGFSSVFVAMGLVFAGGAILAGGATGLIRVVSGLLVVALGLNLVFDFLKFLNLEARFHPGRPAEGRLRGIAGAFVVGLAFAAGWSPCIGPILASILLLAAREGSMARAALLLSAYSLGLALPFLAVGLAFDRTKPFLDWAKARGRGIRMAAGAFLAFLGILMAFGKLGMVSGIAARAGFAIAEARTSSPAALLFIDLGLWAALAVLIALPSVLKAARGRQGVGKAFTPFRAVILCLVLAAALGEALGLWSAAAILAGWLTFQGA